MIKYGIIGTILFMGAGLAPIFFISYDSSGIQNIGNWGQFISGVFAPIAFVWVVIAVLLQSRELELQRKELAFSRRALELQAEELKNSVEQLKAQAEVLSKQFDAQREQKALTDIQEGIHGICSILIEKFGGEGMTMSSGGKLTIAAWFSAKGMSDLLENENYTFLISEISNRLNRTAAKLKGQADKFSEVVFGKIPLLSEIDTIIAHVRRTLDIPKNEMTPKLQTKFELEYPLNKLLDALVTARELCVKYNLAKP